MILILPLQSPSVLPYPFYVRNLGLSSLKVRTEKMNCGFTGTSPKAQSQKSRQSTPTNRPINLCRNNTRMTHGREQAPRSLVLTRHVHFKDESISNV